MSDRTWVSSFYSLIAKNQSGLTRGVWLCDMLTSDELALRPVDDNCFGINDFQHLRKIGLSYVDKLPGI